MMWRSAALSGLFVAVVTMMAGSPAGAQMPDAKPSPELERLHFQLGSWQVTTRTLDRSGRRFVVSTADRLIR